VWPCMCVSSGIGGWCRSGGFAHGCRTLEQAHADQHHSRAIQSPRSFDIRTHDSQTDLLGEKIGSEEDKHSHQQTIEPLLPLRSQSRSVPQHDTSQIQHIVCVPHCLPCDRDVQIRLVPQTV
jgi:hypothetical protein